MYSWGNVTEKLRIASFDCSNEVVLDLFAGVGYFTLVYLVKSNAKVSIGFYYKPLLFFRYLSAVIHFIFWVWVFWV